MLQTLAKLQELTMNPHPPAGPQSSSSHASPRIKGQGGQGRNSQSQIFHNPVTASREASSSSSSLSLRPSNADGRDSSGYNVGSRCQLEEFMRSFYDVPLGSIGADKQIRWIVPNWKKIHPSDKVACTKNCEAKKIMELVVHLATEQQLNTMATPPPSNSSSLASMLNDKREAIQNVVSKVLQFLLDHEDKAPKTKPTSNRQPPPKVATTGALAKRWSLLDHTKLSPDAIGEQMKSIHSWNNAGVVLAGAATTSSDSMVNDATKKTKKRRRKSSKDCL